MANWIYWPEWDYVIADMGPFLGDNPNQMIYPTVYPSAEDPLLIELDWMVADVGPDGFPAVSDYHYATTYVYRNPDSSINYGSYGSYDKPSNGTTHFWVMLYYNQNITPQASTTPESLTPSIYASGGQAPNEFVEYDPPGAPPNNMFANRQKLNAMANVPFTTVGATPQQGEDYNTGPATIWYEWIAPSTGRMGMIAKGPENSYFGMSVFRNRSGIAEPIIAQIFSNGTPELYLMERSAGQEITSSFDVVAGDVFYIQLDSDNDNGYAITQGTMKAFMAVAAPWKTPPVTQAVVLAQRVLWWYARQDWGLMTSDYDHECVNQININTDYGTNDVASGMETFFRHCQSVAVAPLYDVYDHLRRVYMPPDPGPPYALSMEYEALYGTTIPGETAKIVDAQVVMDGQGVGGHPVTFGRLATTAYTITPSTWGGKDIEPIGGNSRTNGPYMQPFPTPVWFDHLAQIHDVFEPTVRPTPSGGQVLIRSYDLGMPDSDGFIATCLLPDHKYPQDVNAPTTSTNVALRMGNYPNLRPPDLYINYQPPRVRWFYEPNWEEVPMRQRHRDDGLATDAREQKGHASSQQVSIRRGGRTYY